MHFSRSVGIAVLASSPVVWALACSPDSPVPANNVFDAGTGAAGGTGVGGGSGGHLFDTGMDCQGSADADHDLVADSLELGPDHDTDSDGIPDAQDDDSDGDGIPDAEEAS